MFLWIGAFFIVTGSAILIAALSPLRGLVRRLPKGRVAGYWNLLAGMTVAFLAGYLLYGVLILPNARAAADLIVPGIFFGGAIFVWLSTSLSLQTVIDVRQVTMLERETETDPLTGVYNRRYFDRRLHEEISRAERFGTPFIILLLDIDHFAQINEFYGRAVADDLLARLAHTVLGMIRSNDVLARYGGDELAVFASNTGPAEAQALADSIRKAVAEKNFEFVDENKRRVSIKATVSLGMAGLSQGARSAQALVADLEACLAQSKMRGGNQVVASPNAHSQVVAM